MYRIIKRNGDCVDFDINKIIIAIKDAFDATENVAYHQSIIENIALNVTAEFQDKIHDGLISVEDIQDTVESVLFKTGYDKVAKNYILYRKQREKARNIEQTMQSYLHLINSYIEQKESETPKLQYHSINELAFSSGGAINANYWLSEIYDREILDAFSHGYINLNGLEMLSGQDLTISLSHIIKLNILNPLNQKAYFDDDSLIDVLERLYIFIVAMQNEWQGKINITSFDTCLGPYLRKAGIGYEELKKLLANFIYRFNYPIYKDYKTPSLNLYLNYLSCPNDEYQKEITLINQALSEIYKQASENSMIIKSPMIVYTLGDNFGFSDNQNFLSLCKGNCLKFLNYSIDELNASIGSVHIDLEKLIRQSHNEENLFSDAEHILNVAMRSLNMKKEVLSKLMDKKLYPFTSQYFKDFSLFYAKLNITNVTKINNQSFGFPLNNSCDELKAKLIEHMRNYVLDNQSKYNFKFELLFDDNPSEFIIEDFDNNLFEKLEAYSRLKNTSKLKLEVCLKLYEQGLEYQTIIKLIKKIFENYSIDELLVCLKSSTY